MTDYPSDTGTPGVKRGYSSVADAGTINTRLGICRGIVMTPSTAGASATRTSISGGTVTIALKTHAGGSISAAENVYWEAWGED